MSSILKLQNKTILIISNEPWGAIWYSKHNWANELSRENRVFFINSPSRWSLTNFFKNNVKIDSYSDSLKILDYNNRLPFTRFKFIYTINNRIICNDLKKWFIKNEVKDYIFWSFDPYRLTNPNLLSPIKSIYFRVDKIHKLFVEQEKEFVKNVDHVIVTSKELLKDIETNDPLAITHGISLDEFTPTNDVKYGNGYILYVGQIDYRLDVQLIEKMLIEFPNERFVFIGRQIPIENQLYDELFIERKYPNLIVHGTEHFKNLKNFIYNSKACIAPMDVDVHGNDVHHHKTLQYLAMGKPIISPIFKDDINEDEFILGYKNSDEAIAHIKELGRTETPEKTNKRITFAKQFSYGNLIEKIEAYFAG